MSDVQKREWVARVLGVRFAPDRPPLKDALAAWQDARSVVVAQLRALSRAIDSAGDPEGVQAIILVQAIMKNLAAAPANRRAVDELTRYLTTDDIIGEAEGRNGFGIDVTIRAPLLPALARLRQSMAG